MRNTQVGLKFMVSIRNKRFVRESQGYRTRATEHMGDEILFIDVPTVWKHEVFGLSGKPATV